MNIVQQFINVVEVVKVRQKSLTKQQKELRTSDPEVIQMQKLLYEMGLPENKEELEEGRKTLQRKMSEAYHYCKSLKIVNDLDLNEVFKGRYTE